jgi:4-hydroxyphenylpyruvate dioxygenase
MREITVNECGDAEDGARAAHRETMAGGQGENDMRRSIATVSLSGTLPEKLEAISIARFDGVEIFENDLTFFPGNPRQVAAMAADLGLAIELFQPFRDLEGVDDATFARNLDRAERKFDLMGDLGAPLMLVCSNVSPDAIDDDERAAAQLRALAERAAKRGLKIGFEALSWGTRIKTFDHAWRLVEKADHPHLGLIVDSFHTLALPDDWSALAQVPGERIFFVQLADAPRLGMTALTLSRHFRCLPGQGEFDVPAFLRAVIAAGYAGPISLEIFNDELRRAAPRTTARDAMRSLLWLEEKTRGLLEAEAAVAPAGEKKRIRRRVELFDPPPAADLDGFAFVEFAVDHGARAELEAWLAPFGFAKLGRHRSKDVDLWGQGDIRFVINSERDSVAQAYYLMHGPSVCALALETDDPHAALARAESYGAARFEGRIGAGEMTIPAIRNHDGSLVYFTGRDAGGAYAFESDFVLEGVPNRSPAGLRRIDHVAEALPEDDLDSWVLFHRAVLGLEPETTWLLPDPYGLVRSRAVSNASRRIRMPLNISEGRRTATARSVSTYSGAGVHHIAFETADIWAAARALKAAGAPILSIAPNYYADVAARFGLDDALVDEMQRLGILYDRTGEAEFFHLYGTPFQDRFFFEVVSRKGGYDLYGAANAPARMAALAELRRRGDIVEYL